MKRVPSLVFAFALVSVVAGACASETTGPGYEQVGGEGGEGGAGGSSQKASAASTGASATSGSGGASSTGSGGEGGQGGQAQGSSGSGGNPPTCIDTGPGEPNDTEQTAHDLGKITDCDNTGSSVSGVLAGGDDVDWYKYLGDDVFGCVVNPDRKLSAGKSMRICKFAQCLSGDATVKCKAGSVASTSPAGRPGCCALQGFQFDDLDCPGVDDDAVIYVRIDNPDKHACEPYTVDYHY